MAIRLVVDSGTDLLKNVAQERNIEIVPLKVSFGPESFTDGVDIDHDLFYEKMRTSAHIPATSLPSPQDFIDAFSRIGAQHHIICITISAVTSGTYQSAKIAMDSLPDYRITLIDSKNISMATGAMALMASDMIKSGAELPQVVDAINAMIPNMHTFIAINDWTNVIKGGRVSNWQGGLAQVLNIKPTLYLTPEGQIHVKDKARGRKRQLANVLTFIAETGKNLREGTIYMLHSVAPQEELDRMEADLRARFNPAEVVIYRLGPIMGSHGGFGTIGFVV